MPHPALGQPPSDATAGRPDVAARVRGGERLPTLALEAAFRLDGTLARRHDERMQRRFLRDYGQHIEQLARAIETGEDHYVTTWAESTVPIYRRRHVRMNDVVTLVAGLGEAAVGLGPAADADVVRGPIGRWIERLRHHRRLPGDHEGNAIVRFIWKGAGLGDDTVV